MKLKDKKKVKKLLKKVAMIIKNKDDALKINSATIDISNMEISRGFGDKRDGLFVYKVNLEFFTDNRKITKS